MFDPALILGKIQIGKSRLFRNPRASNIFMAACWCVSLATFLRPIYNPDIFWHLQAAQRIVATHSIPRTDWITFTMLGRPWIDFEWLAELIWYAVLKVGGFGGLVVLKASILSAAAVCLWRTLKLYSLSLEGRSLALLAWSIATIASNDLRPDNFSLLFFMLEWWLLEARRLGRGPTTLIGILLPVYVLWANLHPGFVIGLALLGIYAAVDAVGRRSFGLIGWTLAAGAVTLINPFGWDLYRVIAEHARQMSGLEAHINEWMAPALANLWMLPFWFILFTAFIAVLLRYLADRQVPAEHLMALGFFSLAASEHNRFSLYFNVIGTSLAACHLAGLKREFSVRWKLSWRIGAWAGLMAYCVLWIAPDFTHWEAFVPKYVPNRIVEFLRQEQEVMGGHRWVSPLHWGGYISYELYPKFPAFIDGRYIFYPLMMEMIQAADSGEEYQVFLDRYAIDIVADRIVAQFFQQMVSLPDGQKVQTIRPSYFDLLPEKEWALVYWNLRGMVFVRRSAFPKAWIERNEFRLLRPFDDATTELLLSRKAVSWKRLSEEMDRFSAFSPDDPSVPALRAWVEGLRPHGVRNMHPTVGAHG